MRGERAVDRFVPGRDAGGRSERCRVAVQPERGARLVEPALAEQRGGRRPERAVAAEALRAKLAAE